MLTVRQYQTRLTREIVRAVIFISRRQNSRDVLDRHTISHRFHNCNPHTVCFSNHPEFASVPSTIVLLIEDRSDVGAFMH